MKSHTFRKQLGIERVWREKHNSAYLLRVLQAIDPSICSMNWGDKQNHKQGVDCFVSHHGGYVTAVDFKFIQESSFDSWLILETLANMERNRAGWAVKPTQAELFVFARVQRGLMLISDVVTVKASALIDLVQNRQDDVINAGGVVKQSHSEGYSGGRWSSEFIAIAPSKLAGIMEHDDLFIFDCADLNKAVNQERNEYLLSCLGVSK